MTTNGYGCVASDLRYIDVFLEAKGVVCGDSWTVDPGDGVPERRGLLVGKTGYPRWERLCDDPRWIAGWPHYACLRCHQVFWSWDEALEHTEPSDEPGGDGDYLA